MKNKVQNPFKLGLLLAAFLMVGSVTYGATYTAVVSGNWSNAATWGGSAPPFNVTAADQILIGAGVTVTMDQPVTLNNLIAAIDVSGTLTGAAHVGLTVISGAISGSGSISASTIIFDAGGFFNFSGSLVADTLSNAIVNLSNSAQITVNEALEVPAVLNIIAGGALTMAANSNIIVSGGDLVVSGGNLTLTAAYNVYYVTGALIAGAELTGSGLHNVTVNVGASNAVSLSSNLTVDTLSLQTGLLMLNGHNLVVNADIAAGGSGMIKSNVASNITVIASATVSGELSFSAADTVHNLNVNISGGGSLKLGSNLVVDNALAFTVGYLDVQGNNLMIEASASITGANSNAYVITGVGGYLTMNANVNTNVTFQVGAGSNYLPAAINLNNGSAVGTIGLNVSAGVYANGNAGLEISNSQPMVNATWLFQNNIGAGLNANMQLSWEASAEVNGFVHSNDYISHYASGWDNIGDSMTATLAGNLYTVTRANITSMSPFAVFDQTTVPTGVASIASGASEFVVYPNPTNENLYVKNPSANGSTVYVEVYNTLGQVVATTQYNNDLLVLPVSSLPEGNYLLRMYNDNMSVVKKFVKIQ